MPVSSRLACVSNTEQLLILTGAQVYFFRACKDVKLYAVVHVVLSLLVPGLEPMFEASVVPLWWETSARRLDVVAGVHSGMCFVNVLP